MSPLRLCRFSTVLLPLAQFYFSRLSLFGLEFQLVVPQTTSPLLARLVGLENSLGNLEKVQGVFLELKGVSFGLTF